MKEKYHIFIVFLGLICFSCGDNVIEEPDPNLFGYDFFPADVGYTWEYQVDSVLIVSGGMNNVSTSSFVREVITELVSDNGNERTFQIERSHRPDETADWTLQDIWQVSIDSEFAVKTEENLSFIKLVFPAQEGEKWDGNSFFDSNKEFSIASSNLTVYKDWRYKIEAIDLVKTYNDITYNDVLQVSHIDEESLISRRFSEEFYAKGVGLVERNMQIFDTQNSNELLDWVDRAESGFQLNQTLISFSKN